MYALCDVNAMYSSSEMVFRPDLRGEPVAVASNGDGIVVAVNRIGKQLGVKKFQPIFKQRHLFDENKCALFSSNYRLYSELSQRFVECLSSEEVFTNIEQYSIDEVFGELPPYVTDHDDLFGLARRLRRAVWQDVRLPIGIGIGRSFTLSKVASYAGKNLDGYRGICILTKEREAETLVKVDVSEVWNVGRATSAMLKKQGVFTALDLRQCSTDNARSWGGVNLERVVRELRGERVFDMRSFPTIEGRKEVSSSLSLTVRAESELDLHYALSQRIAVAAEKLRKLKLTTRHIIIYASNSRYDPEPQSFQAQVSFEYPTDDTRQLIAALSRRMRELYFDGVSYYKVGCRLIGLESTENQQVDLFAPPSSPKLMQAVDALNQKFGYHAVAVGAQCVDGQAKMLRERLSPNYLSEWKDLPRIRC